MPAGPITVELGGARLAATALDTVTTPTGVWPVADLGPVEGGRAYRFGLQSRPEWWSFCIVRYPVPADGSVGERLYEVKINSTAVTMSILAGSMRCVDNGEPVPATSARLRQAVTDKRVVPYSNSAFSGFPTVPTLTAGKKSGADRGYRPASIYWRGSGYDEVFGNVSGSAGEADSSRGFLSEDDAVLIGAAMAREEGVFASAAARNRIQMLYGLSVPYQMIWSENHHKLRDPQQPFDGDRAYTNEGSLKVGDAYVDEGDWCAPADYPYLSEIEATAGTCYTHGRNEAHLFNHGYAYWLASGDPRAALLQQSIAAYTIGSNYQRYSSGQYRVRFNYQRATLNFFSAMWKLQDVAKNVATVNGHIFWSKARADKMVADILADWDTQIAAMDATPASDIYSRASALYKGTDYNGDCGYSGWMIYAYGPEAAYLFASAGKPSLLRRIAEHDILVYGKIGGALGYWGPGGSSAFKVCNTGEAIPYADEAGFVNWVKTTDVNGHSTTTFNGAPAHYLMRAYWSLRMAKDAVSQGWMAPVAGLDDALAKMEAARAATTSWSSTGSVGWKHAGTTF